MAYEVLDDAHPPSGGWEAAHAPEGRLDVLDLETLPMTLTSTTAQATGSRHPRRGGAVLVAALVAGLGLAAAWNAHLPDVPPAVTQPAPSIFPAGSGLTTRLTGPTSEPILLLHNGTHHSVRVSVDPASSVRPPATATEDVTGSPRVGSHAPDSTLTSDPELPVVLFADQTIAVLLRVKVRDCQRAAVQPSAQSLVLSGAPIAVAHTVPRTESTVVDLLALVAAERTRVCSGSGS